MAGAMIRIDVTIDDDILLAIEDTLKKAPGLMRTAYKRNVGRLRSRILAQLKVEPKKPSYPLRWQSERQRRAFFATNGFGGGIPYQRTGKLLASYDVQVADIGDGGVLSITNNDPKARFVIGDDAQMMHIDTGWKQIAPVASDARVEAESILIDTWFTVVDGRVG